MFLWEVEVKELMVTHCGSCGTLGFVFVTRNWVWLFGWAGYAPFNNLKPGVGKEVAQDVQKVLHWDRPAARQALVVLGAGFSELLIFRKKSPW